jgi:hypothetical protein
MMTILILILNRYDEVEETELVTAATYAAAARKAMALLRSWWGSVEVEALQITKRNDTWEVR